MLRCYGLDSSREGIRQDEGGRWGVVAVESGLLVGWLDCEWRGPATPVSVLRGVEHLPTFRAKHDLAAALTRARRKRARAMRACRHCGERFIPGHMGPTACHGCMEEHEHVQF
jgi:hypothetical protein